MLILPRKAILALEVVVDVALHARPDPVQAHDITRRQNVPQRYLEQIMQTLARAGILRSVRGPKGGYRLARERRRIMAGEIVRAIARLENMEEGADKRLGVGYLRPLCNELADYLLARLDTITVAQLCKQAHILGEAKNAKQAAKQKIEITDFTI